MRRSLLLSPDLKLPLEAVTETFAILAKRGAGKTYTASVLVEELLKAKSQVVVLDPIGAWWGLRSSADGTSEGFPVAILGGDHHDIPLEATGGALAADLAVDDRLSMVLDLSDFNKKQRRAFVADFLVRLYMKNRDAMHVVLEEADLFAPEGKLKTPGDEEMLGAVYDLVRRGRQRGLGCTLITQRSASISKEVLTQTEILIALRTTGPHDIAAIKEWIRYHGSDEERDQVLSEIHSLPTGEAFVWWPVEEILRRVKIRPRETFDSSATPKPGQTRREPKSYADVDLAALTERMQATIEKAQAQDPKLLQQQLRKTEAHARVQDELIAGLQAELEQRPAGEPVVERVEVPAISAELAEQLTESAARLSAVLEELGPLRQVAQGILDSLAATNVMVDAAREHGERREMARRPRPEGVAPARRRAPEPPPRPAAVSNADSNGTVTGPEQRVLDAIAYYRAIGHERPSKQQVGMVAGYRVKKVGGTFGNILGALRSRGLIAYPAAGVVSLTDEGAAIAQDPNLGHTNADVQAAIFARLSGPEQRVLQNLIDVYPEEIDKVELGARSGYTVEKVGGTFGNILGGLRSLGLIEYPAPGVAQASDVLFPHGT